MSIIGSNVLAGASGGAGAADYQIQRSLRFNSGDSAYLSKDFGSAGNRQSWSWSAWVKKAKITNDRMVLFGGYGAQNDTDWIEFGFDDDKFYWTQNSVAGTSTPVFRDPSAWQHVVVNYNGSDLKFYSNSVEVYSVSKSGNLGINVAGTHRIGRSPSGNTRYFDGYLADVHFIDGQALAPTDFGEFDSNNVWQPKAFSGTYGTNGFHLDFSDNSSNAALGTDSSGNSNTWTVNNLSAPPSNTGLYASNFASSNGFNASYPAIKAFDGNTSTYAQASTTGGTLTFTPSSGISYSSSIKINMPSAGATASVNGGSAVSVANSSETTIATGSGTLTSLVLTASNLPGLIYIKIDDQILVNSGLDSGTDSLVDTPTNYGDDTGAGGEVRGNYATFNPLSIKANSGTMENGNLTLKASGSYYIEGKSTIDVFSVDNYSELTVTAAGGASLAFGIGDIDAWVITGGGSYVVYRENGAIISYPGNSTLGTVSSYTQGDVLGMAVDDTNVKFYKNGTLQGTYTHGKSGTFFVIAMNVPNSGTTQLDVNFGQRNWAFAPPSGYKALCTTNMPEPTIADGSAYMDVALWTGQGNTNDRTITTSFNPEFVWIKSRSNGTYNHALFDANRGYGTNNVLSSNTTGAEGATDQGYIKSSTDSSITLGVSGGGNAYYNGNNFTYAAWYWDAGANSSKTYAVTVVSDSGNKYRFDGHGTSAVTLDLEEGSTYTFDQSDSSNAGHPLRFSTTSNGTHGGGSEYTTGVVTSGTPGSAGAYTKITIASGAPTLYYYCTQHSGMGGQINTNSTAGASNFDGSLQATVRANPTAGFSIVSVTEAAASGGSTVGHGLNAKPQMIIEKNRDGTTPWYIHHSGLGDMSGSFLRFDTSAKGVDNAWNLVEPTSTTFGIDPTYVLGDANADVIYYLFAPVEGYSAMGSFSGISSADGPFVYTGFRPAFVLLKCSTAGSTYWSIQDKERLGYNPDQDLLFPNTTDAENATSYMDFLSNGFKLRINSSFANTGGQTFIYYAVAENPFKTARAR